jgi:hypothetical protein
MSECTSTYKLTQNTDLVEYRRMTNLDNNQCKPCINGPSLCNSPDGYLKKKTSNHRSPCVDCKTCHLFQSLSFSFMLPLFQQTDPKTKAMECSHRIYNKKQGSL